MKSYRYTSFSGHSGLHPRWEVRKLIQIHGCFERLVSENEELVPTNCIFISRLDLMLQWAKQGLVAAEGYGDVMFRHQWCLWRAAPASILILQTRITVPWASSIVEELCYGEDIPDPWGLGGSVETPLALSPRQYTAQDVIHLPSLPHFTQKETPMHL